MKPSSITGTVTEYHGGEVRLKFPDGRLLWLTAPVDKHPIGSTIELFTKPLPRNRDELVAHVHDIRPDLQLRKYGPGLAILGGNASMILTDDFFTVHDGTEMRGPYLYKEPEVHEGIRRFFDAVNN